MYKCHGFRPQHRILDGRKQRLLLHYREMKLEVAKWGTPNKYNKKKLGAAISNSTNIYSKTMKNLNCYILHYFLKFTRCGINHIRQLTTLAQDNNVTLMPLC